MRLLLVFSLIPFFSSVSQVWAAESCSEYLEQNHTANQQIAKNDFKVDRNLVDYLEDLPAEFGETLKHADRTKHWIDLGSGEAFAMEMYYGPSGRKKFPESARLDAEAESESEKIARGLQNLSPANKARTTAITVKLQRQDFAPLSSTMRILSGRFFENIANEEVGRFDIATDVIGIASYTPELSLYLSKVIELMNEGGAYYGALADRGVVHTALGEVSLIDWLKRIKGLKVKVEDNYGLARLTIKRNGDSVTIPVLKFLKTDQGVPPTREFEETSEKILIKP